VNVASGDIPRVERGADVNGGLLTDESRSWVGRSVESRPYTVTAVDIAKFAYSIGASDGVHFDAATALAHGFPAIVAPLGYYLVIRHTAPNLVPLDDLYEDGASNDLTPPSNATRRMAGDCRTRFHRRIFDGDVITVEKRITGVEEKRGRSGPLALVSFDLQFRAADGEPVVEESYMRILR
jgi:3-methylfumaryl-CoA hydratase